MRSTFYSVEIEKVPSYLELFLFENNYGGPRDYSWNPLVDQLTCLVNKMEELGFRYIDSEVVALETKGVRYE